MGGDSESVSTCKLHDRGPYKLHIQRFGRGTPPHDDKHESAITMPTTDPSGYSMRTNASSDPELSGEEPEMVGRLASGREGGPASDESAPSGRAAGEGGADEGERQSRVMWRHASEVR